jgi:hypothetical protein
MSRVRVTRSFAVLIAAAALLAGPTAALATTPPPTLTLTVSTGPSGTSVGIAGTHFGAGLTYTYCMMPTDATSGCGYSGVNLGTPVTADGSGTLPSQTVIIPDLKAGAYRILAEAPVTGAPVTTTAFTVTAPTLALSPASGPSGLGVAVTGSGYAPSTTYVGCINVPPDMGCGYTGIQLSEITTDATGALPAGAKLSVPGLAPGSFQLGFFLKGGNAVLLVTSPFTVVAPTITLSVSGGAGGTPVTLSGTGLAPGGAYQVCLQPAGLTACGYVGTTVGTFTADASGAIPAGTTVTIPPGTAGNDQLALLVAGNTATVIAAAPFALAAGTVAPTEAPTSTPAQPTMTAASASTPGQPSPSPAAGQTTPTDSGSGSLLLILVIVLLIVLAAAFGFSRRRRTPTAG